MSADQVHLIDNATLSGVQRLLGESTTFNLSNLDNDICFEKLISAILFGTELVAIDDYKPYYREPRKRAFPYIKLISPADIPYRELCEEASLFAKESIFAFNGSKPVGDALAFFQTLKIDPQLRWDIFTSSEYLTLSYLVSNKNDPTYEAGMSAAFGNEMGDAEKSDGIATLPTITVATGGGSIDLEDIKSLVHEFSKSNPNFSGKGSRDTLEKVIFGYGWIAERSYFYQSVAALRGASSTLSPLRDAFCETSFRLDYKHDLDAMLHTLAVNTQKTVASIVDASGQAKFVFQLPFFTAYLLTRCANVREAVQLAFDMHDLPEIAACRDIMSNLQHVDRPVRVAEINRIVSYLEQECLTLVKRYGVETSQGLSLGVSVGLSGVNINGSYNLSRLFRHYNNRPFGKVFRSMARDMVNTERLGALYEKATLLIQKHKDARHSVPSIVPKFMEKPI